MQEGKVKVDIQAHREPKEKMVVCLALVHLVARETLDLPVLMDFQDVMVRCFVSYHIEFVYLLPATGYWHQRTGIKGPTSLPFTGSLLVDKETMRT